VFAPNRFDNGFGGIAPSRLHFDRRYAETASPLAGRHQDLSRQRFEDIADIPFGPRQQPHLLAGQVSCNRHDRQITPRPPSQAPTRHQLHGPRRWSRQWPPLYVA
jgi:hypothetical protein